MDVVAALAMPRLHKPSTEQLRPLPLTELHRLPRDTSMLYGIGRVDTSGRLSERSIVRALDWQPGQRLDVALIAHGFVIHSSTDGPIVLPQTQRLAIPLTVRRRCDINAGDYLLLAAAPEHGVVIVHTAIALDDMLIQYHTPSPFDRQP